MEAQVKPFDEQAVAANLERAIHRVERCLGVPVTLSEDGPIMATIDDREQSGCKFTQFLGPPSQRIKNIKQLHESVYHQRGRAKYREQGGLCANCSRVLNGSGETDHVKTRGAHGRDDRLPNLQVVCAAMSGGCNFHAVKHGQSRRPQW